MTAASSRASTSWTCATPVTPSSSPGATASRAPTSSPSSTSRRQRRPRHDLRRGQPHRGGGFIPLTVGGGVRTVEDVDRLLRAGADKVGVNTAAIARPALLAEAADRFGAQCMVLSVDCAAAATSGRATGGFEVTTHGGRSAPASTPSMGRARRGTGHR